MKPSIIALALAVVLVAGGAADLAAAQSLTPGVDHRQARQHARILDGVADGSLTAHETSVLLWNQSRLARKEWAFESDGVVTPAERRSLHRTQNRLSRQIYRQKHD